MLKNIFLNLTHQTSKPSGNTASSSWPNGIDHTRRQQQDIEWWSEFNQEYRLNWPRKLFPFLTINH